MPEIKLKPCPFCGKKESVIKGDMIIVCSAKLGGCGASTGCYDTLKETIEAWNRRAEDLIEMPCKVGDKVYVCYESPYGVLETTIDKIIIHKEFTQVVFTNRSEFTVWDNDWSTYKKSVFFTRDEAERALEEHKNETD